MGWIILGAVVFVALVVFGFIEDKKERERVALLPPDEQQKYHEGKRRQAEERQARLDNAQKQAQEKGRNSRNALMYGPANAAMICPHCQTKGTVHTKQIKQKKGVSGGKATAAVLTGGLSVLAVGLSRKEGATQAFCDNCNSTWLF